MENVLIRQLRGYQLPEHVLPLARNRHPFKGLDDQSVADLIVLVVEQPERHGRLTDAFRAMRGIHETRQNVGRVIEAHIDCTAVPRELMGYFVRHGFEPDHFHAFVPDCYPDHFTLKFITPEMAPERFKMLYRFAKDAMQAVIMEWAKHPDVIGYVEFEVYDLRTHRRVVPFQVPESTALAKFPFGAGALEQVEVPCETGRLIGGIGCDTRKSADIHVKTPLSATAPNMEVLRARLRDMGFYEVVTEAANKVYTAQFVHLADAKLVYKTLSRYFRSAGGMTDITLEPCAGFWRSKTSGGGLARIPPLVIMR